MTSNDAILSFSSVPTRDSGKGFSSALTRWVRLALWLLLPGFVSSAVAQIYVANAVSSGASITTYGLTANGNIAPSTTLTGGNTGLGTPYAVAVDSTRLYTVNLDSNTIRIFSLPLAAGNQNLSPAVVISSPSITDPEAIAVDATRLYVVNSLNHKILIWNLSALTTTGTVAPAVTISGAATGLNFPQGIAVDATNIYVANSQDNKVLVFALNASGNVAPTVTISGAATGLNAPQSIAVNAANIFVANSNSVGPAYSVTVYALNATGNATPVRTISGASTGLKTPYGLAVDASSIYVANRDGDNSGTKVPIITVFALTANGNVTPATSINGSNTALNAPLGLAVAVPPLAPVITSTLTASGTANAAITPYTITAVNAPTSFGASGLPTGLAFDTNTGIISGTPTQSGTFSVTISATNAGGTGSATLVLTIATAAAPTVASVVGPVPATYRTAQPLDFVVNFSSNVTVNLTGGTPSLALTLDTGGTVAAAYVSGSTSTALVFRYTIVSGNSDPTGVVLGAAIALNGGTIKDSSNNNAILTLNNVSPTSTVFVDAIAPTIAISAPSATTTSTGPVTYTVTYADANFSASTLANGNVTLNATGTATATIAVTGTGTTRLITLSSITGSGTLGISIAAGTASDTAGNLAPASGPSTTFTVTPASPTISSVTAPANGTYNAGAALNFTVTFSQSVTVTGSPSFPVTVGSTARTATYVSGSGTAALIFRYTVVLGDNAASGIAVASPIVLNGDSINATIGGAAATLTFTPPATSSILVSTAPALVASSGATAFTSADNATSTPVVVDSGITLTDPSLSTFSSSAFALVTITGNYQSGTDVLSFTSDPATMGTIQGQFFPTAGFTPAGTLALNVTSGTMTLAQLQAALRAVKFTSTAVTPNTASRTLSFKVNDGTQDSNTVTKTITVTAVNQTPVVTTGTTPTTALTGGSAVAVDSSLTVTDRDSTTLASANITIASLEVGLEAVAFTNTSSATFGNITSSYVTIGGVPNLVLTSASQTATLAQWQAALRAVTYSATTAAAGGNRTITFVVNDGTASSIAANKTVNRATPAALVVATSATPSFSSASQTVAITATITNAASGVTASSATGAVKFTLRNSTGTTVGTPVTVAAATAGIATASYTLPGGTPSGTYTISADYAGEPGLAPASDSTRVLTVSPASIAINARATASSTGYFYSPGSQSVTVEAVELGGQLSEGTVTFTYANSSGTVVGAAATSTTFAAGRASATYTLPAGTAAGAYRLVAVYNGTGNFAASFGALDTLTLAAAPTSITASGALSSTTPGQLVLSATVTSTAGTVAGGTVTFTLRNAADAVLGTVNSGPVAGGQATATYSPPAGTFGTLKIQATYNPPAAGFASSNGTQSLTLAAATTTTASGELVTKQRVSFFLDVSNLTGGFAFDRAGNLYVSTMFISGQILKRASDGTASVVAPTESGKTSDLAFDGAGNLYVANYTINTVSKITSNGTVSTFVSSGLSGPSALAFDGAGNLYVANANANTISKVTSTGTVSTFVSSGLNGPFSLAFDTTGNLYVANANANTISKVTSTGGVSTFVSLGRNFPFDLAFDSAGILYVATLDSESPDGTISKVTSTGTASLTATVTSSAGPVNTGTVTFTLIGKVGDKDKVEGSPVTSGTVTNGTATASYPLPFGSDALTAYTIQAVYNPGATFTGSTGSGTLTATFAQAFQIFFGGFSSTLSATSATSETGRRAAAAQSSSLAVVINPDRTTGTIIGFIASLNAGFSVKIAIADDDTFTGQTRALTSSTGTGQALTFTGKIANGVMTGAITELSLPFTATVDATGGSSASAAGLLQSSSASTGAGSVFTVVGTQGQVFALVLTPTGVAAGTGTINATGNYSVTTAQGTAVAGAVTAAGTTTSTITLADGTAIATTGLSAAIVPVNRLANLSLLSTVAPGQTITTGFVIGGQNSKTILTRAIGPGLAQFNVNGALTSPTLTLFDGAGRAVLTNSSWAGDPAVAAAASQVGAFALTAGSRDSAAVATLQPGAYTVQVTGGGNGGRALAEIYDLDPLGSSRLASLVNESSLGPVAGSATLLIAGFVIDGNTPKQVLIRGIGPALTQFGVSGALATPLLRVYDGMQTVIAQNQAWGTPVTLGAGLQAPAIAAAISAAANSAGAFPLPAGSNDSAVLITLPPGSYTVHLAGANGAAGSGLIEIYQLP